MVGKQPVLVARTAFGVTEPMRYITCVDLSQVKLFAQYDKRIRMNWEAFGQNFDFFFTHQETATGTEKWSEYW